MNIVFCQKLNSNLDRCVCGLTYRGRLSSCIRRLAICLCNLNNIRSVLSWKTILEIDEVEFTTYNKRLAHKIRSIWKRRCRAESRVKETRLSQHALLESETEIRKKKIWALCGRHKHQQNCMPKHKYIMVSIRRTLS